VKDRRRARISWRDRPEGEAIIRAPRTTARPLSAPDLGAGTRENDPPRIVKKVDAAREHGNLSPDDEYHAAKEEQQRIEGRITSLEQTLSHTVVVNGPGLPPNFAPQRTRLAAAPAGRIHGCSGGPVG
jgi:hypothetical protein